MEQTPNFGKILVVMGLLITGIGLLFLVSDKFPFLKSLGRLPGDVAIERENVKIYFPWVTSLLLSIGLSLAFWLFSKFGR